MPHRVRLFTILFAVVAGLVTLYAVLMAVISNVVLTVFVFDATRMVINSTQAVVAAALVVSWLWTLRSVRQEHQEAHNYDAMVRRTLLFLGVSCGVAVMFFAAMVSSFLYTFLPMRKMSLPYFVTVSLAELSLSVAIVVYTFASTWTTRSVLRAKKDSSMQESLLSGSEDTPAGIPLAYDV